MKSQAVILLFISFFALHFMLLSPAKAQGFDVGIYPPIIQAQVTPPTEVKIPIYLENFQDQSIDLSISLRPFRNLPSENGELEFINNPELADPFINQEITVLNNNIAIDSITLSPKQKKQLTLAFKIPNNEPKGDYYFSLTFTSANQNLSGSNGSQTIGGIASNILLTVGPIGKTQGRLEEFSAPKFISKGPLPFTVKLRNTSDHFISPTGNIVISNIFGQNVGKINLLQVNLLAGSIRRIPDNLQADVSKKDYQKIKTVVENSIYPVAVWPEMFLLGPYKATLSLSLSENGPIFTRAVYFFAFPVEYVLGILITIGIIIFIAIKIKRKIPR